MPGMYSNKDYDLAGFSVGAVERDSILPSQDIKQGDLLLGLASSGVHSNGFSLVSLVRKIIERAGLSWSDESPFDGDKSIAQAFLEPTRIYVKPLLAAIRETGSVKAMAHITGGGFTENIPVFGWLSEAGGVAQSEMLRTFNCGIGMVVVVSADNAQAVTSVLEANGEDVVQMGELIADEKSAVTYEGTLTW